MNDTASVATENIDTHLAHVVAPRILLGVFAALVVLTALTVAVSYFDLGELNLIVALSIATVKASLVALWFMHLRYDSGIYSFIFLVGVVFLGLFLIITMLDSVQYQPNIEKWQKKQVSRVIAPAESISLVPTLRVGTHCPDAPHPRGWKVGNVNLSQHGRGASEQCVPMRSMGTRLCSARTSGGLHARNRDRRGADRPGNSPGREAASPRRCRAARSSPGRRPGGRSCRAAARDNRRAPGPVSDR